MKPLLLLLALEVLPGQPKRVVLLDETVRIEAMRRSTLLTVPLDRGAARLELRFRIVQGGDGVKLRVRDTTANRILVETGYRQSDEVKLSLERTPTVRVEIENMRQHLGFTLLDVHAALVFPVAEPVPAQTLDPVRRYFTVWSSIALFAMMVSYASVRLGSALWQRFFERSRGLRNRQ